MAEIGTKRIDADQRLDLDVRSPVKIKQGKGGGQIEGHLTIKSVFLRWQENNFLEVFEKTVKNIFQETLL